MTKRERQILETEAAMDGKPRPLRPLERVYWKIEHFRQRSNGGVSIRLNCEEADALTTLLQNNIPMRLVLPGLPYRRPECGATDQEYIAIFREANRYKVGVRHQ